MAAKRKVGKSGNLATKAQQILAFAEERARHAANWVELHNALFGLGGKATELLATESERTAFSQTAECKRVFALLDMALMVLVSVSLVAARLRRRETTDKAA